MSPQVLLKKGYTKKTDIYSCGVILYELLYGNVPYLKYNTIDKLKKRILNANPSYEGRKLSKEMRVILEKMMEIMENDRPSIEQILNLPEY